MVSSTFSVVHAWYGANEADQHTEHAAFGTVRDLVERKCVVGNELVVPSSLSELLGASATILAVLVQTETGEDFHLRFQDGQGGAWSPAVEGVVVVNAAETHVDPCDWASDDDQPAAAADDDEDDNAAAVKPVLGHEVAMPPPDAAPMEVVFAWYGIEGGLMSTKKIADCECGTVLDVIRDAFFPGGDKTCIVVPPNLNTFFGDPVPNAYKVLAVHVRNTVTGADQHLRFHEHVGGSWSFADGPNHANAHNAAPRWTVVNASYGSKAHPVVMGKCNVTTAAIVQSLFGGDEVLRIQPQLHAYFGNTSAPGGRQVLRVELVDHETGAPTRLEFVEGTAVEWDGTTPPEKAAIQLRVVDAEDLSEVYFKIKPVTPLRKLFDAYCLRRGIPRSSARFMYLGAQIDNDATTTAELGMRGNKSIIEFQKKDAAVSTIPTTAIIDAWYGHPTDPSKRNAEPKVAHTIDHHFFNANDRSVLRVPADLNRHFGDPAPNVVKVLSFTVCVTGAPEVFTLLFKEHEGGEVSVTSPESMAPFRTSTAPSTAELHARIAAEKRENAALHEELAALRAA